MSQRLFDTVQGNLHNSVREAPWGNPGTVLAAIHMAEATGDARWIALVREAADALVTNSLAATDEPLVHVGYSRYRKAMVRLGSTSVRAVRAWYGSTRGSAASAAHRGACTPRWRSSTGASSSSAR